MPDDLHPPPEAPDAPDAPEPTPAAGRFERRTVLGAGLVAVAGTLGLAGLTAPRPGGLGGPSGDEQLTTALAGPLSEHRRVAIALLETDAEPRFAGFGADQNTEFEIGSVTKVLTGALLAEAVSRGEVTLESTIAEVLGEEAGDSPIADVTLTELATHSAGLPTAPNSEALRLLAATYLRQDPYGAWGPDQLVADALATTPSTRGEYSYSNLGVGLEGQLLSRLAGAPYEDLVTSQLLEPLGMDSSYVPITPDDLQASAPRGHTATGLAAAPWTMNGYAPAGCVRSTAADLAVFLAGTRDGTAPGADAAREVLLEANEHMGLAINWHHSQLSNDSTVIWHNGVTGGYSSFAGWDSDSGRAVLLLSDTATPVDEVAFDLLTGGIEL